MSLGRQITPRHLLGGHFPHRAGGVEQSDLGQKLLMEASTMVLVAAHSDVAHGVDYAVVAGRVATASVGAPVHRMAAV